MASRQGIITALKTQLALISTTNGYTTNIGSNVDEWRLTPYDVSELPVIEVRDEESRITDGFNNVNNYKSLGIRISCYASVASTGAATMRNYIKDVLKAIGTDPQLGGNAMDVNINSTSIEGSQDNDILFSAVIDISAEYLTTKWSD